MGHSHLDHTYAEKKMDRYRLIGIDESLEVQIDIGIDIEILING